MVGVGVADVTSTGEGRDDDERNAGSVTEEVQRLNVAGVVIAAALVEGDDERRFDEEFRPCGEKNVGLGSSLAFLITRRGRDVFLPKCALIEIDFGRVSETAAANYD